MARVPTYDNLQATPNSLPTEGIRSVQAPVFEPMQPPVKSLLTDIPMMQAPRQMPDIVGRTLQHQGEQMSAAGRGLVDVGVQVQHDLNLTRVSEAKQDAEKSAMLLRTEFLQLKGKDAMERPGDMNMADEFTDKLIKNNEQIGQGLGNDAQRKMFGEFSHALSTQFYGQAMTHMASEAQTYKVSVHKGQVELSTNQLALDPDGPDADRHRRDIRENNYQIARLSGKSEKEAEAASHEAISKASTIATTGMLEQGNYGLAAQYLRDHAGDFRPEDRIPLEKKIRQSQMDYTRDAIAKNIVAQNQPTNSDWDRFKNLIGGRETGNSQWKADGTLQVSSKGAIGWMQIMPGTGPEAADLAGEKWDEERLKTDPAYNRRLGEAYLRKQYMTNDGDLAKTAAAYNGGPGALGKAIKEAKAEGKPDEWLSHMKKETRDYVADVMDRYNKGEGAVRERSLGDMREQARRDFLSQHPTATTSELEQLDSKVNREDSVARHDRTTTENDAIQQAYEFGSQNNWDWNKLPQHVKDAMPVDKRIRMEDTFAKAGAVKTDQVFFAEFKAKSVQEKANFQIRDFIANYHDKLNDGDMETALGMIAKAKNENPTSAADQSAPEYIRQAAIGGGILPATGKFNKGDVEGAERFNRFHDEVITRIRQEEQANGARKMAPEKVQELANKVALEKVSVERFGPDRTDVIYSTLSPEDKARAYKTMKSHDGNLVEVPVRHHEMLFKYLAENKKAPTEANMARLYQNMMRSGLLKD